MTHEEEKQLRGYLVEIGEIEELNDDDGFEDWYEIRRKQVQGETLYKAILQAARTWERALAMPCPTCGGVRK